MAPSLIIKFWLKLGLGYCVFTELNVKKCLWFCDFVVWMLSVRLQERKQSLPCTVHIYLTYLSWKQARSTPNTWQLISFQISARIATAVRWMLWKWKWWSKEVWGNLGDHLVTSLGALWLPLWLREACGTLWSTKKATRDQEAMELLTLMHKTCTKRW